MMWQEIRQESRQESLRDRVLNAVSGIPLSKLEIASVIGHKGASGQLNKVIADLLSDGQIEFTIPTKPQSRLQKYRRKPS